MDVLTQTLWRRHTFDDKERLVLASQMAQAEAMIRGKQDELKSVTDAIKADISVQVALLHSCAEKLRSGFYEIPKECNVSYAKGIVKYVDKDTGEILEERPMTDGEQATLAGARRDAESLIRQDNEESE